MKIPISPTLRRSQLLLAFLHQAQKEVDSMVLNKAISLIGDDPLSLTYSVNSVGLVLKSSVRFRARDLIGIDFLDTHSLQFETVDSPI